jgi:hypothetical protein
MNDDMIISHFQKMFENYQQNTLEKEIFSTPKKSSRKEKSAGKEKSRSPSDGRKKWKQDQTKQKEKRRQNKTTAFFPIRTTSTSMPVPMRIFSGFNCPLYNT